MAFFQSRKILLLTAFIIIAGVALWMNEGVFLGRAIEDANTETEVVKEQNKVAPYLERIDNFALEEYTEEQLLSHFIEADTYFNFEDSPILLLNIKVTTYDEFGNEGFTLLSNRANLLRSGEVFFNGEVSIRSRNGIKHEIETESLIIREKMKQIKSSRDIVYLGENAKVYAQGMLMNIDDDTMALNGDSRIEQDSGSEIKTKNLFIDQSDGQKHYHTIEPTTYLSEANTINADMGMDLDMNQHLINLQGGVEILQSTGATIQTKNLIVDQSNGREIYKTDNTIHYQSTVVDIVAQSMYFDANKQRIELMGGVRALYE